MEFLKETFGDSENGVRWGGVLAAVLGIGGGFYLGGGIGAAIGLASSLLAAPIMNEIFFNVNRATGNVKPPARNNDIKPNVPLEAAPAPVRQPDNKLSPTTIKAPLLKNLVPPPPGAVAKQFEKREEIRKIIVDREGGRADFEKASKEARDLEAQTDTFIATVDKYSEMRDEYHKDKGERSQLVGAVKTALGRTGITNALTQDEIERFVPSLPTLSAEQKAQVAKQMADSFPEKIKMLGDSPDLPLRQSIERSFTKGDDGKPNPAKVEAWKKKSGLEKLNYSLDRLNEMRADLESRSKLDFKLAAGGEAEAAAWRAMPPAEMYSAAKKMLSRIVVVDADMDAKRNGELQAVMRYANILHARAEVEKLVKKNLGDVATTYTKFREEQLVPAAALANEFATQRLDVFNETGIAIMTRGSVEAAKGPNGKACTFLTYKDCTAPAGSKETTLVMQDGKITHKFEGGMPASKDWSKDKLLVPVEVNATLFNNLAASEGKTIGASIRAMIDSVKEAKLVASVDTGRNLRRQFEADTLSEDARFAYADTQGIPSLADQPAAMPAKKKEKIEGVKPKNPEMMA